MLFLNIRNTIILVVMTRVVLDTSETGGIMISGHLGFTTRLQNLNSIRIKELYKAQSRENRGAAVRSLTREEC